MPAPARFANGLGQLQGIAFHHEIQVANAEAGQHVAHGPAGQEHVDVGLPGGRLDVRHHPVLIRTQVALQHVDVIAHRMRSRSLSTAVQARGWCLSTVSRSLDRITWV